jgi:LCP family protein required for cell wall assembly
VPSTTGPPRKSRRSYWSERRKIAIAIVLVMLCMPIAVVGWFVADVTRAIGDAQDIAVVDLPEREESETDGSGDQQPLAMETPAVTSSTRTPNEDPSSLDVARGIFSAGTGGENTSPDKVWPDKQFLNILVLGIDTRPDGSEQNADVIIVARLDLKQKTMNSVSIPRDLLVTIPGHGEGKINGAYGAGLSEDPDSRVAGVSKMRDTIEYNFGIPIDDYVLIDFEGFKEVVDSVGGIEITVPTRIEDHEYPTEDYGVRTLIIEAGHQHMDGETALSYARTRHGDSDDKRRERQMLVIQALFDKGKDLGTITRVADLITALSSAAQTSFHWNQQLALASLALNMSESNIRMMNVGQPLVQPGTASDGAWVYMGDPAAISAFIESSLSGE